MIAKPNVILSTALLALVFNSCQRRGEPLPLSFDSLKPAIDSAIMRRAADSAAKSMADSVRSALPPMAKAVEPSKLALYFPKLPGWTLSGEMEHELQIRDNFNRSRAAQTYTSGGKKLRVEINDFAYVPYLYEPWQKFKGNYLDDDNVARTETTMIAGYRAVQTMEKRDPHASVSVFPGIRYVVTITMDGADNINDARRIAESMDLRGLEALQ